MSSGVGLVPIGLGVSWLGYTVGIWGYCLVRGYNVTFTECFKGSWPGGSSSPASPAGSSGSSGSGNSPGSSQLPGAYNRPGAPAGATNPVGSRL
jgi:hypothetical protein